MIKLVRLINCAWVIPVLLTLGKATRSSLEFWFYAHWRFFSDPKSLLWFSLKVKSLPIILIWWNPGGHPGFRFFAALASILGKKRPWKTWPALSFGPFFLRDEWPIYQKSPGSPIPLSEHGAARRVQMVINKFQRHRINEVVGVSRKKSYLDTVRQPK